MKLQRWFIMFLLGTLLIQLSAASPMLECQMMNSMSFTETETETNVLAYPHDMVQNDASTNESDKHGCCSDDSVSRGCHLKMCMTVAVLPPLSEPVKLSITGGKSFYLSRHTPQPPQFPFLRPPIN